MRLKGIGSQRGSGGAGIAACMLGFSLVYFVFYFIVNWIYDTKEDRKYGIYGRGSQEVRVVTQEEVMKRGIGQHVFKCYGFLGNSCRGVELYKSTVESHELEAKPSKHSKSR